VSGSPLCPYKLVPASAANEVLWPDVPRGEPNFEMHAGEPPRPDVTFRGRAQELCAAAEAVLARGCGVQLLGGPGVGKSAIAPRLLGWLAAHHRFPAGLIALTYPAPADAQTLLADLGNHRNLAQPTLANIIAALGDRSKRELLLLALDNFEELLRTDAKGVVTALSRVITAVPNVRLLITSQQRLELSAHLGLPTVQVAEIHDEGSQQKVFEAHLGRPLMPEEVVSDHWQLNRSVAGGVPLALALIARMAARRSLTDAAARLADIRLPSLHAIADPGRRRHAVLNEVMERAVANALRKAPRGRNLRPLLQLLAYLPDGLTVEEAGEIWQAGDALADLAFLHDHGLAQTRPLVPDDPSSPVNYYLLTPLRSYLLDQARGELPARLADRAQEVTAQRAAAAEEKWWRAPAQRRWAAARFANLRALVGQRSAHPGLAGVALSRRDYTTAARHYKKVPRLYRRAGERYGLAHLHYYLATLPLARRQRRMARRLFKRALAGYRAMHSSPDIADTLLQLAQFEAEEGYCQAARAHLAVAQALAQALHLPDLDRRLAEVAQRVQELCGP
jgi:hypothetical protein